MFEILNFLIVFFSTNIRSLICIFHPEVQIGSNISFYEIIVSKRHAAANGNSIVCLTDRTTYYMLHYKYEW